MLNNTKQRFSIASYLCLTVSLVLWFVMYDVSVDACSPGRTGSRRRSARKLTPLVFKQHVPNVPEHSLGASGPPEGRIYRDDTRFQSLVPNYNSDIVFKDEEGTGVDRLMSRRCKEKLDTLAISVMNMWPGVRLRVIEGFDEDGFHPQASLHYEGRAVAISTSDRDPSKYGMLARLAVDAGFDWVFYESRSHIYCSVKTESKASARFSGCFHGSSQIKIPSGTVPLNSLKVGDDVVTGSENGHAVYSKVIGFLHRDVDLEAMFLQINVLQNRTLLVTPEHLVFKGIGLAVHASYIRPGDSILTVDDHGVFKNSSVISVDRVILRGVYAPITDSGTIVVDGVMNSCYAVIRSHSLAHFVFLPLRIMYRIYSRVHLLNVVYNSIYQVLQSIGEFRGIKLGDGFLHFYARFLCDVSDMF